MSIVVSRRDFLSMGVGAALVVPASKTLAWAWERDRIQRAMDGLVGMISSPVQASELKPSDDATLVWPVAAAYLRMLSQAEGTYIPGKPDYDPYRVLVGSRPDRPLLVPVDGSEWSKHPGFRWKEGTLGVSEFPYRFSGTYSTAAGAYQFIDSTWQSIRHDRGFAFVDETGDFSPDNQDRATLYLTGLTGGHWWLRSAIGQKDGHIWVDHKKWLESVRCDSREWASLKGANIGSATGQTTKPDWWVWSRFIYALWEATGKTRHILFPASGYGMGNISDRMRWRSRHPVHGGGRMHWGTDVGAPQGTPILAPEGGTVVNKEAYGFSFVPERDPTITLRFFHCRVKDGVLDKWVPQGEVIGQVGPKDHMSTGPHLHFEVKAFGYLIDSWFYLGMSEWFKPVS